MSFFEESYFARKRRLAIEAKRAKTHPRPPVACGASPLVVVPPTLPQRSQEPPIQLEDRHWEAAKAYAKANPAEFPSFPAAFQCLLRAKAMGFAAAEAKTEGKPHV